MNLEEFDSIWMECIHPSIKKLVKENPFIKTREGSKYIILEMYNSLKNYCKRAFMTNKKNVIILDRHKVCSCLIYAIVKAKPLYRELDEKYTGTEESAFIANEALAITAGLSLLRAYIVTGPNDINDNSNVNESYLLDLEKFKDGFVMPPVFHGFKYESHLCWALYHSNNSSTFDILTLANNLFLIEAYTRLAAEK